MVTLSHCLERLLKCDKNTTEKLVIRMKIFDEIWLKV